MVPSWLNIFHPQFFHLQFWDGTLLMQDLAWGPPECQCVASSGAVFGALWFFFARLVKLSFFMAAAIYFEIFEQNVVFVHAKCVTKLAQVRRCLWPDRNITMPGHHFPWPDRNTKFAGPPWWPDRDFNFARLPAYGRTETSNSPDLSAYGRTETSNSPDLRAYGRTVRQTYVRPAGPPCLWPDRPPALELTKLLNGGKGCSRRKHGYRQKSGSRALLAFPFLLALYARVLSKPG